MNGDFDLYVLNGKIKELNEKIISIKNSIDSIKIEFDDLNIGNPADTGGSQTEGTVMAKENAILEAMKNGEVPAVKSIQRGYVEINSETTTIQISEVDVNKTFVSISGYTVAGLSNQSIPWITQVTPTSITVSGYGKSGSYYPSMRFSWQAVEFY